MASRLKNYRRKRDFAVTPEPAPEKKKPARGRALTFMVHKHDATRLHYDLRLEIDGALASWAVPKGPSFDPKDRRLAVQTEDHPLSYGAFEGRIPDGEYGAGDSIVWDRGTWDTIPPGQAARMREKGHLEFELSGEKLKGRWHLVRTRPGAGGASQWLLFKGKDALVNPGYDVVAERPESVVSGKRVTRGPLRRKTLDAAHPDPMKLLLAVWPPMLATLSKARIADPAKHVFEVKYDGFRALAGISNGKVTLQSRNGLDLSVRFPEVFRALHRLAVAEAVLDGEIVALDEKGVASFQRLQNAASATKYFVFDVLWLDGEDLRARPLEERRDLLESVLANPGLLAKALKGTAWSRAKPKEESALPIALAERVEGEIDEALADLKRRGGEGLIAKRRGSRYAGGRARDWQKLKVSHAQELAVLGFVPISNGANAIGALHVGYREGSRWRYAGKVGTGFTDPSRRALWTELKAHAIAKPVAADAPRARDAVWVEPTLVAQLTFAEWTDTGMLRHPVFHGLRPDKSPTETERPRTPTYELTNLFSGGA